MIKVNDLTYFYTKQKEVLDSVSMQLDRGKVVGLLGRNGTGKTTLLHLLAGLLQPKQGNIEINGFIPFDRSPRFLGDVYFVPDPVYPEHISITNYLKAHAQFYPKFDYSKFARLIDVNKIDPRQKIDALSTGQVKQVILSFALSTNVSLILLDEPTNGLDIPSKDSFKKLIAAETSEEQTVIISTHQAKDIELLIDHIIIIHNQKIALNRSMLAIQDHYGVEHRTSIEDKEVVFAQSVFGGYKAIVEKSDNYNTMDLELLFYAVIEGKHIN